MNNLKKSKLSTGFSLVEIMVAMTIGLVTVLVVGQVMQVAEARKRASTSGADAIVNAALGLYAIERDGKNAGYGLTSIQQSIGCEVRAQHDGEDIQLPMVPASIGEGINGRPDTVRFIASSKSGAPLPIRISQDHPRTAANFFVESDIGVHENDLMIAVPQTIVPGTNWCSVFQVTGTGGANGGGNGAGNSVTNGGGQGQNQVLHNSGQSDWNQPGGSSIFPAAGYAIGDYVLNLGSFIDHTYSIANNHLRQTAINWANYIPTDYDLYPHVVQLQAVYGKDTSGDGRIDVWEASAPAQWSQVIALRVALVARGEAPESGVVTLDGANAASSCNSTTPHAAAVCWKPDPNGNGVKIDVNIGNTNPNWQRYRYRVVETTIPLRNTIWRQ